MDSLTIRISSCFLAVWLTSCISNDTPLGESPTAEESLYRLSTEFQGLMHPLSVKQQESGNSAVMLAETLKQDNTQLWTLSSRGDGYYRIRSASSDDTSLAVTGVASDESIQMSDTDDQSAQLWQVIPLDNGYCRITSQLFGQERSLDVVSLDGVNDLSLRQINLATTGNFSGQHWQLTATSGASDDDTLAQCAGTHASSVSENSDGFIPTSAYRLAGIQGFQLLISPELDAAEDIAATTLGEIEKQLEAIVQALPASAVTQLKDIPIWVEWNQVADGIAQFHPSREWLQENGYNPDKAGNVEISNANNFIDASQTYQPAVVLHEMAHAWQFTHPKSTTEITAAFDNAQASGVYELVEHADGTLRRAYALENNKEYFAELTEAYFATNDFYPFVRDELQRFDSDGFALIRDIWSLSASSL